MKKIKERILKYINKSPVKFLDELLVGIIENDVLSSGASLTYFSILSFFPFLIALLNLVNYSEILDSEAFLNIIEFLPDDVSEIILGIIHELLDTSNGGLLFISIAAGLFTASRGIKHLIVKINDAYGFEQNKNFIALRIFAIVITIALIFMVIILSFAYVFGEHIIELIRVYTGTDNEVLELFFKTFRFSVPIAYMIIIFSLLYKYSAAAERRAELKFKYIFPGAVFTTITSILATKGFGIYVSNFGNYSITYGSLGGIIVMLVWMYLMNTLILIGAEVVSVLYKMQSPDKTEWPERKSILDDFID